MFNFLHKNERLGDRGYSNSKRRKRGYMLRKRCFEKVRKILLLVKASFLAHVGGSCFLFNSAFLIPKLIVCNCGSLELWLYHLAKAESNSYLKWGLNKLKEMKFELDLTELSYFLKAGWPCLAGMIKQYFIESTKYPIQFLITMKVCNLFWNYSPEDRL